jgi:hypothetical protein
MNVMTCREMEPLLRDMALGQETETELEMSSEAAAHLEGCPRCSSALERERRLTASLAELARSLEPCEVPAAMDARLLAAFRKHSRDCANRRPVFRLFARRPAAWAAGAAAIVILSLGVGLGVVLTGRQPSETPVEPRATPTASLANPEAAGPNPSAANAARPLDPRPANNPLAADATRADRPSGVVRPEAKQAAPERSAQAGYGFVPLFYGGDPQLLEAGQVWRVEMPRSALQSVGMPVVEESRSGRIQVDILLGEDGIARGIRLVQ